MKADWAKVGFEFIFFAKTHIRTHEYDVVLISKEGVVKDFDMKAEIIGYVHYSGDRYILLTTDDDQTFKKWEDLPPEERSLVLKYFGVDNQTVESIGNKEEAELFISKI